METNAMVLEEQDTESHTYQQVVQILIYLSDLWRHIYPKAIIVTTSFLKCFVFYENGHIKTQ